MKDFRISEHLSPVRQLLAFLPTLKYKENEPTRLETGNDHRQ